MVLSKTSGKKYLLSIHVDGYYGLTQGVPRILSLLEKYNLKATFFVNMGREANLFQILKYRRSSKLAKKDAQIIDRYTLRQKLEILFLNRNLGNKYGKLLKLIEKKGHEVEPHCWSHLIWSKNFEKVNYLEQIKKMKKAYKKIFKRNPLGFAPPTWKFNDKIIKILKDEGFEYLATDKCFEKVVEKRGLKIIPLSFGGNIEELVNEGKSIKEILDIYKKELKKDYVNIYFHADYEGIKGIDIFESILNLLKEKHFLTYSEMLKNQRG